MACEGVDDPLSATFISTPFHCSGVKVFYESEVHACLAMLQCDIHKRTCVVLT